MVHDLDLNDVTSETFTDIRAAFEQHSALLFPKQSLDDAAHTRLAEMFGPLENREAMAAGRDVKFEVSERRAKPAHAESASQHALAHRQHVFAHARADQHPDSKGGSKIRRRRDGARLNAQWLGDYAC